MLADFEEDQFNKIDQFDSDGLTKRQQIAKLQEMLLKERDEHVDSHLPVGSEKDYRGQIEDIVLEKLNFKEGFSTDLKDKIVTHMTELIDLVLLSQQKDGGKKVRKNLFDELGQRKEGLNIIDTYTNKQEQSRVLNKAIEISLPFFYESVYQMIENEANKVLLSFDVCFDRNAALEKFLMIGRME